MASNDPDGNEQGIGEWTGPTLKAAADRPGRLPLCADCPAAWWYKAEEQYESFCTKFRSVMFSKGRPLVTACDARDQAITEAKPNR